MRAHVLTETRTVLRFEGNMLYKYTHTEQSIVCTPLALVPEYRGTMSMWLSAWLGVLPSHQANRYKRNRVRCKLIL